ncbi:MAG: AMP-binding protein [Terriglobales bacterium]
MRTSLFDYLDEFERWGEGAAYVFPRGYRHERWSYGRVAVAANQFARELAARNIVKGDAVILWGANSAEWVAAFLGCAFSGVIAVPVDEASSAEFARRIGDQVRTRLVVCGRERAGIFPGVDAIDPVRFKAAIGRHSAARFRAESIQASDTLEIVFTSGTTAEPKGVVLSHANVAANLAPIAGEIGKYLKYERIFHPLRFLNLLPLSHVFGQFLGIFLPPLMGATVVFESNFNPAEIIATIRRERVSVLVAVPRIIESLKQRVERQIEEAGGREVFAADFRRAANQHFLRRWWSFRRIRRKFGWKFWAMISGGAALDHETEEFWHRLGYAVVQGYGLTETTSLISLNHPFRASRGSIGKVLPGREMRVAEDGEILVRGSGVASGYWSGGELVRVTGEEGWYHTGDLGALDEQGNLFFKGRKKEVIVTAAGMNVYPEDLEAALRAQPEVRDAVVVGLERGGNAEACAAVILREGGAAGERAGATGRAAVLESAAKAAVDGANQTLAEYQKMRRWVVWPDADFPRTSTGKPRRNVIREAVAARLSETAGQSIGDGSASPLAELVARITGRAAPKLGPGANLEGDLGLTSLERVELLGALEDRYQVDLSETSFAGAATVGDVERLLRGGSADLPRLNGAKFGSHTKTGSQTACAEARSDADDTRDKQRTGRGFHYPRWTLRWPATWVRLAAHYLLLRPAVFVLGWPRVIGGENLRGVAGPLLVISNHIDDVDVGFIQTALPARLRNKLATATGGEALEALRSPAATRWMVLRAYDRVQWALGVTLLNLFPLPREAGFRKSFAYAGEAVDRGYSVLVFPEGRHTEDGKLRPFRTGVGLLANNLGIPVLPMRIDGLYEVKKAGRKFALPGRIQVRIGKPVQFAPEKTAEEIARELRRMVESL